MDHSTDLLNGFDMVAAISQAAINSQLEDLFYSDGFPQVWNLGDINTSACSLTANLAPPTVSLATSGKPNVVILFINMPSGTLTYWEGFGPSATQQQVNFENWVYAFDVNVDFLAIEQSDIANSTGIPEVVQNTLTSFNSSMFTIQSLFMDFENSNIADYDTALSSMSLPNGSSLASNPNLLSQFQLLLQDYFKSLQGTNNPYILGYTVNAINPSGNTGNFPIPTFVPTGATFSTLLDNSLPNGAINALNFLVMTNNHTLPTQAAAFSSNWIKNNEHNGKFVISEKIFWEQWLLPLIESALYPPMSSSWATNRSTTTNSTGWSFSRNDSKSWVVKDGINMGMGIKIDAHNYESYTTNASVSYQNQSDTSTNTNQVVITLTGNMVGYYSTTYYPLDVKTVMDETATISNWSVIITVTASTNGILSTSVVNNIPTAVTTMDGNWTGQIDEWLSSNQEMLQDMGNDLGNALTSTIKNIGNLLGNINAQFVAPAGDVFFFSDISMDNNGNVLLDIDYKEEN